MGFPVKVTVVRDVDGSAGFNIVTKGLTVTGTSMNSVAFRNGLRDGAVVRAIDGKPVKTWDEYKALAVGHPTFVMTLHYPRMTMWFAATKEAEAIAARTHDVVVERDAEDVEEGCVAFANGLRNGEKVLAVDGHAIATWDAYKRLAIGKSPFTLTVLRLAQ